MPKAKFSKDILANKSGEIIEISNKHINELCRMLGTPQNSAAGIYLYRGLGKINSSEKILTLYSESKDKLDAAIRLYKKSSPVIIK